MCGTTDHRFQIPKQLYKVGGEPIVARTIRLLRENGIEDIAISSNLRGFEDLGVPVLHHDNEHKPNYTWCNCFYPVDEPTCFLFGDVVFSENAIKTIIETQTDDIEFFASAPPFGKRYMKEWAEPFAFKVQNVKHLWEAKAQAEKLLYEGKLGRLISWELWQVIKGTELNKIDYTNYTVINDYTCDVDYPDDYYKMTRIIIG